MLLGRTPGTNVPPWFEGYIHEYMVGKREEQGKWWAMLTQGYET